MLGCITLVALIVVPAIMLITGHITWPFWASIISAVFYFANNNEI